MDRRFFLTGAVVLAALPRRAFGRDRGAPTSEQIFQRLDAAPERAPAPAARVSIDEFRRRPELRRHAPSIDIQAINFAFGSAEIPDSEFFKVREIARAFDRLFSRRRSARFLIEGHTDAVGSREANQALSERRAAALKQVLVDEFDIRPRILETVGYGEDFPLIDSPYEEWENRRVTLRRIDAFVR